MKITIEGTEKEVAALVLAIQERRDAADIVIQEINRRTSEAGRSPVLT